MSKIDILRVLVNERLQIATEEVFRIVERTIVDYEEEVSNFKKVIDYQRKLLAMHKAAADPILLSACDAAPLPEQQKRRPPLDRGDPEHPRVKEEPEELWTNQGDQPDTPEEDHATDCRFTKEEPEELWANQLDQPDTPEEEKATDCGFTPACVARAGVRVNDNRSPSSHPHLPAQPPVEEGRGGGAVSRDGRPRLFSGAESADDHKEAEGTCWHSSALVPSEVESYFSEKSTHLSDLKSQSQTVDALCKVCGSHFPCLLEHAHTHVGDPRCTCGVCGDGFASTDVLLEHMSIHASLQGRSRVPCGYKHTSAHGHERRHGCDFCGRSFSRHSNMLLHRRCHTGEKPYHCSLCEKRFSDRSTMNMHTRVHTGEKPYHCSLCGKRFSQSAHLKRHSKTHSV